MTLGVAPLGNTELLSSVHSFFIGTLAAGQSAQESILMGAGNSSYGNASINATLEYYSANYKTSFSKYSVLNLSIAPSATFSISSGPYSIEPGSTNLPVVFVLTNTGNVDAQNIQVSFQSQYPITPVTSTYYISELRPGESANVTFRASVDQHGSAGEYPVTVYEAWRQPNGAAQQEYSGSDNYYAVVSASSSGMNPYTGIIEGIAVVAVVLVVAMRIMKGKSKKRER